MVLLIANLDLMLVGLRTDARFQELLQNIGLSPRSQSRLETSANWDGLALR
jgi:hypothetical protein